MCLIRLNASVKQIRRGVATEFAVRFRGALLSLRQSL